MPDPNVTKPWHGVPRPDRIATLRVVERTSLAADVLPGLMDHCAKAGVDPARLHVDGCGA
jgi:hypothetical protein